MKKTIPAVLIFLIFIFWTAAAWATDNEIVIGISTGYPPYYYQEKGELKGICIEVVDNVAQSMGLKPTFKQYPWKRLLFVAENGEVDAIMPLFKTKERERYLYFDNLDLVLEENSLFTWKNRKIHFDGNFETIQSHTIGVISDYSYGEKFDNFMHFTKVVTKDDEHLMEMFKHNRFDIGIGSKDVVLYNARKENISNKLQFLAPHITKDPLYIGFSKKKNQAALSKKFADELQRFKLTATYQQILDRYRMTE